MSVQCKCPASNHVSIYSARSNHINNIDHKGATSCRLSNVTLSVKSQRFASRTVALVSQNLPKMTGIHGIWVEFTAFTANAQKITAFTDFV